MSAHLSSSATRHSGLFLICHHADCLLRRQQYFDLFPTAAGFHLTDCSLPYIRNHRLSVALTLPVQRDSDLAAAPTNSFMMSAQAIRGDRVKNIYVFPQRHAADYHFSGRRRKPHFAPCATHTHLKKKRRNGVPPLQHVAS